MQKLFIDKTIKINAPASKVWQVLTESLYTDQWVSGFSPGLKLESGWKLGDPVKWREPDGKVVVEGTVTKIEPEKFLRFTVIDVVAGIQPTTEEDGITFELTEKKGQTKLRLRHGDFAVMPEGQKYYEMTLEPWEKILPKVKELAEK